MLVAAVQIALGLFSILLAGVLAAPPASASGSSDAQVILAGTLQEDREYENGELPPTKNTLGWIDPRLKGGRFIDVRTLRLSLSDAYMNPRCCSTRVMTSENR